jgi:hypothetical protein
MKNVGVCMKITTPVDTLPVFLGIVEQEVVRYDKSTERC